MYSTNWIHLLDAPPYNNTPQMTGMYGGGGQIYVGGGVAAGSMGGSLLSPVPSDLSVESVGSHSRVTPCMSAPLGASPSSSQYNQAGGPVQQQHVLMPYQQQPGASPHQHPMTPAATGAAYYVLGPVEGGASTFAYPFSPPPSSSNNDPATGQHFSTSPHGQFGTTHQQHFLPRDVISLSPRLAQPSTTLNCRRLDASCLLANTQK